MISCMMSLPATVPYIDARHLALNGYAIMLDFYVWYVLCAFHTSFLYINQNSYVIDWQ